MPRKPSHNERTQKEREVYARDLRERDATPTVEQSLPFPDKAESEDDRTQASDQPGVNFSKPSVKRARKISWTTKAANHVKANLVGYLIAVFILIGGWLVDLRFEFSGFKIHFNTLKEEVLGLKGTSKEHDKQLQQQEIKLREHDVRLDTQKKVPEKSQ